MDLIIEVGDDRQIRHLADGAHLLGRGNDVTINLHDQRVSRHHASILVEGEKCWVEDLGSANGTKVRGERLSPKERWELKPGERFELPGATLWISDGTAVATSQPIKTPSPTPMLQSVYIPGSALSDQAQNRVLGMLDDLFKLLASAQRRQSVVEAACGYTGRSLNAARCLLMEVKPGRQLEKVSGWSPDKKGIPDDVHISEAISEQVITGRKAIIIQDIGADKELAERGSLMGLRSVMAAPIFEDHRVRYLLYLDRAAGRPRFNDTDLQVCTVTANAVGVKLKLMDQEQDAESAARIQQQMLPSDLPVPDGWSLDTHLEMCQSVGGDLFHVLNRPSGNWMFALGDVSGKGMPAALAMGASMVLMSSLNRTVEGLESLSSHMHRQLAESLADSQFLTLFLGSVDPKTGKGSFINAGHVPPMILRSNGEIEELPSTGLPMGLLAELVPGIAEFELHPGETLLLMSDGVDESSPDGETLLGLEPVRELLLARGKEPLPIIRQAILTMVEEWRGENPAEDDTTLLLVRREP